MTAAPEIEVQIPEAYRFLFEPARYKIAKSGRGAGKSWSYAQAVLLTAVSERKRIVCARETMKSIKDSVHALLRDWIGRLNLGAFYEVKENAIVGRNGTEIGFTGLRQLSIDNLKSLEGVDIFWIEEGQTVSKRSWKIIVPTIRKPHSEIWVSYNPELETDETHQRFVLHPPPDAVVVTTSWRDNPWFHETTMPQEMQHDKETDYQGYLHIWEGHCRSAVEGAVFGEEMKKVSEDGRITSVPVDRTKPVDTYWDLGFGDSTAIWFMQAYGGWYNLVDYLEDEGQTIEWYLIQLQQRGYVYGADHLPWDSVNAITHKKLQGDRSRSIEMILRAAGRNVRVTPALLLTDQLNAARTILPQCRFDETKCYEGLRALRSYQWAPPTQITLASGARTEVSKREPLHDQASHGASAFMNLAVTAKQPAPPKKTTHHPSHEATTWS